MGSKDCRAIREPQGGCNTRKQCVNSSLEEDAHLLHCNPQQRSCMSIKLVSITCSVEKSTGRALHTLPAAVIIRLLAIARATLNLSFHRYILPIRKDTLFSATTSSRLTSRDRSYCRRPPDALTLSPPSSSTHSIWPTCIVSFPNRTKEREHTYAILCLKICLDTVQLRRACILSADIAVIPCQCVYYCWRM